MESRLYRDRENRESTERKERDRGEEARGQGEGKCLLLFILAAC